MKSWKFPNMLGTSTANIWKPTEYLQQTKQNTVILLNCEKNTLFGDPDFGLRLKKYLFEQNSAVLRDALTDEIYTQLALFIPQIKINRKDVEVKKVPEKGKLIIQFSGINQIDYQPNMYQIELLANNQ